MENKSTEELLKAAFRDATPTTIAIFDSQVLEDLLRDKSPLIVQIPNKSPRDQLIELYNKRKQKALETIDTIPRVLDQGRLAIQQLYDETRECIMFGLYGAAITLCGVMLEFVLKYVTYHWNIPEREYAFDLKLWDSLVEHTQFEGAIVRAIKYGVINEHEAKQLRNFKDEVRNTYSHYNIKKLVKNIVVPVKRVNMLTGTSETVEMIAEEQPPLFPHAKKWRDERVYMMIHVNSYNVSMFLLHRLDNRYILLRKLRDLLKTRIASI